MFLLKFIPVFFIVLFLAGFIILLRAYVLARKSVRWPYAPGTIDACRIRTFADGNNSRNWVIKIRYRFFVEQAAYENSRVFFGGSITGENRKKMFILEEAYKKGERVKVYYNPSNPRVATLETGAYQGLLLWLIISMGGLLFSAGIFINLSVQ